MNRRAVRAILGLIADAESLGSVRAFRAELVRAMAAVFPCEVVVFNEFQLGRPREPSARPSVTCTRAPPLEPRSALPAPLMAAFLRHMPDHPLIRLPIAGDLGAHRLSDAVAMRRLRRTSLYGEFLAPAAIHHQLGFGLESSARGLTGMWFSRARREFTDDDLVVAELLRPHLRAAEEAVRCAAARTTLTTREREVIDIAASGASNAAIAEVLVVSPATVKKHLDNIYGKLGVGSRTEAVGRAGAPQPVGPAAG